MLNPKDLTLQLWMAAFRSRPTVINTVPHQATQPQTITDNATTEHNPDGHGMRRA